MFTCHGVQLHHVVKIKWKESINIAHSKKKIDKWNRVGWVIKVELNFEKDRLNWFQNSAQKL